MSDDMFIPTRDFPFQGPEVTWAGPNHLTEGLCFGFDDGSVSFWIAATDQASQRFPVSRSKEAVNGVAHIGTHWFAVSTRADISFMHVEDDTNTGRATYPAGSHGIVASPSGYYFAALGNSGLLVAKPERGEQLIHVMGRDQDDLYFNKVAIVHDASHEVLVFANRRHGVGVCEFQGLAGSRTVQTLNFEGLDVVDVCGIRPNCLAAIAISPKAELIFLNDVLSQDRPISVRLGSIQGVAYRVLCARGHVFVLTSKAVYVCFDFVEAALLRQGVTRKPPLVLPLEAIDINIMADQHLILVMADNQVKMVNIDRLIEESDSWNDSFQHLSPSARYRVSEESIDPVWESGNAKFPVKMQMQLASV